MFQENTKHLYNVNTMLVQRQRSWADVVQILYKCFVFAGLQLLAAYLRGFARRPTDSKTLSRLHIVGLRFGQKYIFTLAS